ncbi:GrpB family protein [Hymenobacter volaticus]|uniref:GrpB family protein n=1 Tax=Hymenobacter volaticus TaxID=2932254 RepID=UPI001FD66991|nr:GrpB family protein [Hymenobacter volaticus]
MARFLSCTIAIELVPYNANWGLAFTHEATVWRQVLGDNLVAIHHIGSTAIPAILAKPVVDILGVVSDLAAVDEATPRLEVLGYIAKGENGIPRRRYFQKKDVTGAHSHHVHLFAVGADPIEHHLAFRDYLRAHPAAAARYSQVKVLALANQPLTRQAYQDAKGPFITALQAEAVAWYRRGDGY